MITFTTGNPIPIDDDIGPTDLQCLEPTDGYLDQRDLGSPLRTQATTTIGNIKQLLNSRWQSTHMVDSGGLMHGGGGPRQHHFLALYFWSMKN